ncbi:hypothetical protein COO91_02551 [Nostoc flagelliforme CCNUN1]|uniref:Uncharacterized protein n=1 Tax=Nostoc flagelliforme CCNUN1 TaxID=2038116 RepID=A0A2K8SMP7_9NOSO|nr:hypothetical protein [Nostoc flagelliforme]AUB36630.1 hypothetical protein COO91_02551 [Nostoc flagelliforme CCNUN1]
MAWTLVKSPQDKIPFALNKGDRLRVVVAFLLGYRFLHFVTTANPAIATTYG